MSHADELILGVHRVLADEFPAMPRCLRLRDEPTGDFGIAHAYGILPDGCGDLSFDAGYAPTKKTIRHELAHLVWYNTPPDTLDRFLVARAFPGTVVELNAMAGQAWAKATTADERFRAWGLWPAEQFADCFAAVTWTPDQPEYERWEMTATFGTPLTEDRRRILLAFYASLRATPKEVTTVTEDDVRRIVAQVTGDAIVQYGSRLQPELEADRRRIDELERRVLAGARGLGEGR